MQFSTVARMLPGTIVNLHTTTTLQSIFMG
jgi:hypothetical protein